MKNKIFASILLISGLIATALYSQPFVRVDNLSRAVAPPQVITVTTDAQYVFTNNVSVTDGRVISRTIQNTGTHPVIYAIGSVASTASYHGVIAAGSAARDGLGSIVDLSRYPGQVSVVTETSTSTIALVELQQ